MSLKYTCPSCGTPLGYEGLCWKCKCEQERQAALAWTPEQIVEKQRNLIQNIQRLADMEDPEFADFWQLLGYHDAITPEIQRVALAAEVFWPCEIYYHAPADVRDGLIHALLSAEYSSAASNLMSCLAMQGDDKAMETLLELERNPRPWRKGLYVDPSSYAQIGGWTFDKEGQKIQLNFDTCYPMVKGTTGEKSPVRIGRAREDTCPHCGGRMVDMLVLDGRDERLKFLGLDGILTATCCPNCVGFLKGPAFNSFTLDGGVEAFPSEFCFLGFQLRLQIIEICSQRSNLRFDFFLFSGLFCNDGCIINAGLYSTSLILASLGSCHNNFLPYSEII